MKIDHAVFGPSKGHAFLRCTDQALEEKFRALAWMTDLPQTVPAGVKWEPFFRLVPIEQYFLLIYTCPVDNSSRGGMVFSRAALIPVAEISNISSLRPIAEILRSTLEESDDLTPIDIGPSTDSKKTAEISGLCVAIVDGMLENPQKPLVVVGQNGFDNAMFEIWERVPSEFRRQLCFGLSFGHEDVRDLTVVCIPPELAIRWDTRHILDTSQTEVVSTRARALLDISVTDSVGSFIRKAEIPLSSPAAVALAVRAAELWHSGTSSADNINLLRILTERGGSGPDASDIKSAVVQRFLASAKDWTAQDIIILRNLDIESVFDRKQIINVLSQWLIENVGHIDEDHLYEILLSWASQKPKPLWLIAVSNAFQEIFSTAKDHFDRLYSVVWRVFSKDSGLLDRILSLLDSAVKPEGHLLGSAPDLIDLRLADTMITSAIPRAWWALCGAMLARSRSSDAALNQAVKIRPASKSLRRDLYTNALRNANDQQLVDLAVTSKDEVAIHIAAETAIRSPYTLSSFNWLDVEWFRLLDIALEKSTDILDALRDQASGLSKTIEGGITEPFIWKVVAKSPFANLLEVSGRENAWALIPEPSLESIAGVTARCWLERYEQGTVSVQDMEPVLLASTRRAVAARGYMSLVVQRAPAALPQYLRDFPFSNERDAEYFLIEVESQATALSESAASAFGRSIHGHSWTKVARHAAYALRNRPDFRPIVQECLDQLSFIDRLWVTYQLGIPLHLSEDDAWNALESEAVTMYPRGPHERELWSRSGGRNEDLAYEETGRANWHRCLRDLRSGMPPGVEALINGMLEDFRHSDTLRQLLRQRFWR